MNHSFSPDDVARLLALVTGLAARLRCSHRKAIDHLGRVAEGLVEPPARPRTTIEFAEALRRLRVRRNEFVGADLFRDPAWDMLLDLLVANARDQVIYVSTLCNGAGVPYTTALRHVDRLAELRMIERVADPFDHRRIIVRLAPDFAPRFERLVAQIQACAA